MLHFAQQAEFCGKLVNATIKFKKKCYEKKTNLIRRTLLPLYRWRKLELLIVLPCSFPTASSPFFAFRDPNSLPPAFLTFRCPSSNAPALLKCHSNPHPEHAPLRLSPYFSVSPRLSPPVPCRWPARPTRSASKRSRTLRSSPDEFRSPPSLSLLRSICPSSCPRTTRPCDCPACWTRRSATSTRAQRDRNRRASHTS